MATVKRLSGKRIYQARLRSNLSLDDVAHGLRRHGFKTNGTTVWRWERERNTPNGAVLAALSDVLHVSLADLYEDGDDDEEAAPPMSHDDLLAALKPIAQLLAEAGGS